ncbi:MAG: glycosyltransferase family 39 protein, partial [Brevundimonas sp.]|nr:glycosyltransferase family 39 protein [Brevundimonas sp.]
WAAIPVIVAAIGTMLGGRRVGLWAGLCALLAPGAAFSARILSTDPPLLLFWSLALLAFLKLRAGASDRWLVVLAAGIGAGLLSKYAMAYFLGGLVIAALIDRPSRQTLQRPAVWLAIAGGLALLFPNLLWNLDHDFVTLRHTGENHRGWGRGLRPGSGPLAGAGVCRGPVRPGGTRRLRCPDRSRLQGPQTDGGSARAAGVQRAPVHRRDGRGCRERSERELGCAGPHRGFRAGSADARGSRRPPLAGGWTGLRRRCSGRSADP